MQINSKIKSPFSKTNQHSQKYLTIISAASELFNIHGTRATTLKQIADKLSLTKTSLYYYFKTKEELVYQCYLNTCGEMQKMIDMALAEDTDAVSKLETLLRLNYECWLDIIDGNRGHLAGLAEVASLKPKHRDEIANYYRNFVLQVKALIEDGIKENVMMPLDPGKTSNAIWGTIFWLPIWLPKVKHSERDACFESWLSIFRYGLSSDENREFHFDDELINNSQSAPSGFNREQQSQRKREAFYHVGTIFFNQKGFKATSLDEIAESLGVTKGAFYYHISDKEELLVRCFQRSLDIESRVMNQALNLYGSGIERLAFTARQLFFVQLGEEGPLIRYSNLWSLPKEKRNEMEEIATASRNILGKIISIGIKDNSITTTNRLLAENLIVAAVESIPDMAAGYGDINTRHDCEAYFRIFFTGIAK